MVRLAALAIGYVFGLFQTAYIYGRMHGIDIRNYGSGNAGTTNTLRVLGTKAGLIVFAGDVIKCVLAIVVVRLLFSDSHSDMNYLLALYAAAGAILGHNYPFYLGFKGGKGIAATAGLILAFHPAFIPVGAALVYAGFMIQIVAMGEMGVFGMSRAHLVEMYIVAAFLTAMAYWKHRENIGRLLRGEERKTWLFKKNKESMVQEGK